MYYSYHLTTNGMEALGFAETYVNRICRRNAGWIMSSVVRILRSFAMAHLKPDNFTDRIIDSYMDS